MLCLKLQPLKVIGGFYIDVFGAQGGFLKRYWRFLLLLLFVVPFCTYGRTLHVGNVSLDLSMTSRTTPSLNFAIGNERYYANMNICDTPMNQNTERRMVIENKSNKWENYYVSEFVPNDANNYIIIDGKLVWANCDIYLQSYGNQYIKTNYVANPNTRVWLDFQMDSTADQSYIFGIYSMNNNLCLATWISRTVWGECSYDNNSDHGHKLSTAVDTERHQLMIGAQKHIEYFTGVNFTNVSTASTNNSSAPIGIFSNYWGTKNSSMRLYNMKVYENDTLVHYFVPVPAGLEIGDYTVPENGLFDIVEQQFYGNAGAGYFGISNLKNYVQYYGDMYTYDIDGNLVDADSRVALESTGTQYIKTDYTANPNTKIYADYQMNSTNAQQYIFGSWAGSGYDTSKNLCFVAYINGSGTSGKWAECSYDNTSGSGHATSTTADLNRHQITLSAKNHIESWTDVTYSNVSSKATKNGPSVIGIFGNGNGGKLSKMILWRLKIWDDDVLAYDFIPVPAGLVIKDYVVPQNGLFDVVEQKFYGPTGPDDFAYGLFN